MTLRQFLITLFIILSTPIYAAEQALDNRELKALELSLSFQVNDDNLKEISAVAFINSPMTIYVQDSVSLNHYKITLIANLTTHKEREAARVRIAIQEKLKNNWGEEVELETFQYLNETTKVSISDRGLANITGEIMVTHYLIDNVAMQNLVDCSEVLVQAESSCCEVPCQDGTLNFLRCCGGLQCCGCGTCCFVP